MPSRPVRRSCRPAACARRSRAKCHALPTCCVMPPMIMRRRAKSVYLSAASTGAVNGPLAKFEKPGVVLIDDVARGKARQVPRVRAAEGPCLRGRAVDRIFRLFVRAADAERTARRRVSGGRADLAAVRIARVAAERVTGREHEAVVSRLILHLVAGPDAARHRHFRLEAEIVRESRIAAVSADRDAFDHHVVLTAEDHLAVRDSNARRPALR